MISQIRNFLRDRYSLLDKSRVVFFTSVILILFLIKKIFIYFEGDYPVQSTPAWGPPFFTDRDVREIVRDYDGLDEENRGYVLSGLFNRPDVVDAIPKLIYISADEQESPNLRMLACQLLGSSSSARPAIPELINILCATPDGNLRQEMAKTLNNLAPWGSDSVPELLRVVKDALDRKIQTSMPAKHHAENSQPIEDHVVLSNLVQALSKMPSQSTIISPVFFRLLKLTPGMIRGDIAASLSKLGADPAQAIPILLDVAKDADEEVRMSAVQAIGEYGADAALATDTILNLISKDPCSKVRENAMNAAVDMKISLNPLLPLLIERLKDFDPVTRELAASLIAEYGSDAQMAREALIEAMRDDKYPEVQDQAAYALGQIASADLETWNALEAVVTDADSGVPKMASSRSVYLRERALLAMVRIDSGKAVPIVLDQLKSMSEDQKRFVCAHLKEEGPRTGLIALIHLRILKERKGELATMAAEALGDIGQSAETAVPELVDCLRDSYIHLKWAAAIALLNSLLKNSLYI